MRCKLHRVIYIPYKDIWQTCLFFPNEFFLLNRIFSGVCAALSTAFCASSSSISLDDFLIFGTTGETGRFCSVSMVTDGLMKFPLLFGTGAGGVTGTGVSSFEGSSFCLVSKGSGIGKVTIGLVGLIGFESVGETISIGLWEVEKCHDFRWTTFRRKLVELLEFELRLVFDPNLRARSLTEPDLRNAPSSSGSISAVREFFRIGSGVSVIVGVGDDRIEFIWEKKATLSRRDAFPGPTSPLNFFLN